jgi:hypothetical protein
MAQIASQRQGFVGKGSKWIGMFALAFIAVAVALAVWAAFAAAPKVAAPAKTSVQSMQEPGLRDQRAGEQGITVAVPAPYVLDPATQLQRREERGALDAGPSAGNRLTPQLEEQRRGERGISATLPNRVLINESMQEQRRGERGGASSDAAAKDSKIHQHLRGHSAGKS